MPKKLGDKTKKLVQIIKDSENAIERAVLIRVHNFSKSDLDARIKVFEKKGWIEIKTTLKNNDAKNVEYKWIAGDIPLE